MNDVTIAIRKVISRRMNRGATRNDITQYIQHLKKVWRNSPEILTWLDNYVPHPNRLP